MGKALLVSSNAAGDTSTASTNMHYKLSGYLLSQTTEADCDILFRAAGTGSKLYSRNITNSSASAVTLRTRKNAGNGGMSVSITAATTGVFEDTSNTDSISAGDKYCIQYTASGISGTTTFTTMSVIFDSTSNTVAIWQNGGSTSFSTASTTYWNGINGRLRSNTTETAAKIRIRKSATSANLGVYVGANARTTNTVFKTRKNAADGNLTVTFGSTVTGWQEDTTHSDTLAAGDDYYYQHATGTGTQTLTLKTMKVEATSTAADGPLIAWDNALALADNTTQNFPIGGAMIATTTENNSKVKTRDSTEVFSEFILNISANTVNATSTPVLRKNGANGNNTLSVTTNATGLFNDTSHTDTVASTDDVNIQYPVASVSGSQTTTITFIAINCNITASTNFDRPITESSISVGAGSVARVYGAARSPSAGSVTVGAGTITRVATNARTISGGSVTVGAGSISRIYNAIRAISDSAITVGGGTITRVSTNARTISESAITVGSGTVSRIYGAIRSISESAISVGAGTVNAVKGLPRTITEDAISVSDLLARVVANARTIPDSVTVAGGTITRVATNARTIAESAISVGAGIITAVKGFPRSISENAITVGAGIVSRVLGLSRTITNPSISVSDTLSRVYHAVRSINQSVSVTDNLVGAKVQLRSITESTISVGTGTITRVVVNSRTILGGTVTVGSGIITRVVANTRTITEPLISVGAGIITRIKSVFRTITESSISVGSGSVTRVLSAIRNLTESAVSITDQLTRTVAIFRTINQTVNSSDSLTGLRGFTEIHIIEAAITVSDFVTAVFTRKPDLIPLYLQSTVRKIEGGYNAFAARDRFRQSESYLRQLGYRTLSRGRRYLSRRAGNG